MKFHEFVTSRRVKLNLNKKELAKKAKISDAYIKHIEDGIRIPKDMIILYNLADAYIYVSLYEGFGLPILEAMQCGCPVIASNTTSIPEVAGGAALLVNPLDTDAIADAIFKVLTDSDLRQKLTSSGYQQAKKFSWDKCATTILNVIRSSRMKK